MDKSINTDDIIIAKPIDNKQLSLYNYDTVIARPVSSNRQMPILEANEDNEYIAIPVKSYFTYFMFDNMYDNFIKLLCCDNKRNN